MVNKGICEKNKQLQDAIVSCTYLKARDCPSVTGWLAVSWTGRASAHTAGHAAVLREGQRRAALNHRLRLLHDLHVLHGRSSMEALKLAGPEDETEACIALVISTADVCCAAAPNLLAGRAKTRRGLRQGRHPRAATLIPNRARPMSFAAHKPLF